MRIQLDLAVELSDEEAAERVQGFYTSERGDSFYAGGNYYNSYSGDPDRSTLRFFSLLEMDDPTDGVYNHFSYPDRKLLRAAVETMSERRDSGLKGLWKYLGRMVPVSVFWTVVQDDREPDVIYDAGQEEYNSIMLSPLEQLAAICQETK